MAGFGFLQGDEEDGLGDVFGAACFAADAADGGAVDEVGVAGGELGHPGLRWRCGVVGHNASSILLWPVGWGI